MIADTTTFTVTTAPKRESLHWSEETVTWGDLRTWMRTPAKVKACGSYVMGTFNLSDEQHKNAQGDPYLCRNKRHRTKRAARDRSALTLDVDHAEQGFLAQLVDTLGLAALVHTTYSHTAEQPRYRIILPLDRLVTPEEYAYAANVMMDQLGAAQFDQGSNQAERYMFRPAHSPDQPYDWREITGPVARVDDLLSQWDPDLSSLPVPRVGKNKRDPFEIEGPVGAFNRAYDDWDKLIQEYELPYENCGADRYKLVGATAAAGMGPAGPGFVYSHHANDPAYGVMCSAFDLTRLHLHGELDEGVKAGTPINRMPSYKAMLETATKDVNVVRILVGADFEQDLQDIADNDGSTMTTTAWKTDLALDSRTGVMQDVIRNWDLITKNDPVFQGLYFNELSMAIETDRDLPWRKLEQGQETFGNRDRSALYLYLERVYQVRAARGYIDDLINEVACKRWVNPARDYLTGLKWDGVPRVERALPGAADTPFNRLVARKVLTAAAARMLDPGCKWDHMLILQGDEGLGKTHWIERMAKGWDAALGKIGDKDTLLLLQRSWIVISDEGHSLKKADFDAQKEFLTRTADVFRMPFERETQAHPRHCVIWGSINDDVFLQRQQGNRRFLIVKCERKVDFDALTDDYIDQVWAEAVHLYRAGEKLYLIGDESELAADARESFTEEDSLAGLIQHYVETKVPKDWAHRSTESRTLWLMNSADDLGEPGTEPITEVCSVQLWVEALGRRRGEARRVDLLEINRALKSLPGWELIGDKWVPQYGTQKVYRRITEDDLF